MSKYLISIPFLFLATSISADENSMRAGLWEITTTSNLLNYASQIPPDQMKNLDDLAKEYGFEMPAIKNGAVKSNTCITQEMANQKVLPDSFLSQVGCVVKKITQKGNSYHADFICENPQVKGNGVADAIFTSMESFTGRTIFNGTVQGTPVNETADITGSWVSAVCGNTKPLQQ